MSREDNELTELFMSENKKKLQPKDQWSLDDPEFYEMERKVFEEMEREENEYYSAVCTKLGLRPGDFRKRWKSLLQTSSPSAVLDNIRKIRPLRGYSLPQIAKELKMSKASVAAFIKILTQSSPESRADHKDSKVLASNSDSFPATLKVRPGRRVGFPKRMWK